MVEHHQRSPQSNNNSDQGKTGIRIGYKSDMVQMADVSLVILVSHVTLDRRCRCGGLDGELDRTAVDGPRGMCGMLVDDPPHICAGTVGGNPTIRGPSVVWPNRCQSQYEGSHGAPGSGVGPL